MGNSNKPLSTRLKTRDATFAPRFWAKVKKTRKCWIWIGAIDANGYGRFMPDCRRSGTRKVEQAHRVSFLLTGNEIPKGTELDHLCRNPACVNPRHLEAVTHGENLRRGRSAQRERTHCKNNHPFPPRKPGSRQRVCRVCANDVNRKYRYGK